MTEDIRFFKKGTDCLSFHEHLFELFLRELDKKNIDLTEHLEEDIKLTVRLTVVKKN